MRRFLKWTLRGVIALVILVALVIGGGLVYLDTGSGRNFVLDQAKSALKDEGMTLSYSAATGSLLSRVVLKDVELRDARGVFFAARSLTLDWSPSALVSRRAQIDALTVAGGRLDRAPELPPATTPAEPSEGPPSLPVSVRVDRLTLEDFTLGADIAGAPVTLTVAGKAAAGRDLRQATLELSYRRTDGQVGRGDLRAIVDATTEKLDLALKVVEGKGGLAATLLELPDLPNLAVDLTGAGTLRGWRGRFKAVSNGADLTEGTVALAIRPRLAVDLDARLNPSPLVPRLAVLKDPLRIQLKASLRDNKEADVDRLDIRTTGLRVTAKGRYALETERVDARVQIEAEDLRPLRALLAGDWGGSLSADLSVDGPVRTAQVAGKVSGRNVRTPWGGADSLTTDLTANLGGIAGVRRLVGTLTARNVSAPQGRLASASGRFDLQAPTAGDYPLGRAELSIRSARASLAVPGGGTAAYNADRLDVTLFSKPQAGRPYPAVDLTLDAVGVAAPQGKLARLTATGTWSPEAIRLNTTGKLRLDLSGLESQWARATRLTVDLTAEPAAGATYPSISLKASGAGLEGQGARLGSVDLSFEGSLGPDATTPLGRLTLDLSRLDSPWAKAETLKVDATSTARPAGRFPKVVAVISGTKLSGQGVAVDSLQTTYDGTVADDARTPLGKLKLQLAGLVSDWANATTVTVDATSAARDGGKFPQVVADVAGTGISGRGMKVATLRTRYDGTVADDARTPLGRLDLELTGLDSNWAKAERLVLDATTTSRPDGRFPHMVTNVFGSKITVQEVSVTALRTSYVGTVADDERTPLGTVKLDATGFSSMWASAASLKVDATSTARPNAATPSITATVNGTDMSGAGSKVSTLVAAFSGAPAADWRSVVGDLSLDGTGIDSPWAGATALRLRANLAGADGEGLPLGQLRLALDGAVAPQGAADRLRLIANRDTGGALYAELEAIEAAAPQAIATEIRARLAGILDRATMRPSILSARAVVLAAETETLSLGTAALTLASTKHSGGSADRFDFRLDLDAEDTYGHTPDTPTQEIGPVTLEAAGTADLATLDVDLNSFRARAGFARASGRLSGTFKGAPRIAGTVSLSGTPPPALLGGMRVEEPKLDLTIDADLAVPDVKLQATGEVARVVTGRGRVDDFLSGKSSFAVTGRYRPGTISLERFSLETPVVTATGGGNLSETGSGTLTVNARVPELSRFKQLVGRDIAGSATLNADLRGSFEKLSGSIRVRGQSLVLDGQTVGRIDLRVEGTDLTGRPNGRLRVTGSGGPAPIDVSARVENRPDGGWTVDGLEAKAFGATASGAASLTGDFLPQNGRLKLSVPNLAPIGRLAGLDLRGSLAADGRIVRRNGRLSGNLKATARGVVLPGARVANLSIDGQVADAETLKGLQLRASASGISASGVTISRLQASARPNGRSTAVSLSARGSQGGKPVSLDATATIVEQGGSTIVTVSRLSGRYVRLPINLAGATKVTLASGTVRIDRATVGLGRGRVTVAGLVAGPRLDAKVNIASLPLGAAPQAGVRLPVRGNLSGTVALTGSSATPSITYDLNLRNLRPAGAGRATRWASVAAKGKFQGNLLDIDARIAGMGDGPVTISARAPVSGAAGAPLQGRIAGTLDLARLSQLGLLGEHAATGKLRVDLRFAGSFGAPTVSGEALLSGGRFENVDTGTVLDDINIRAVSAGNALRIQGRLTDGASGTARVEGRVLLSGQQAFPLEVRLIADRAHLMRRDGMDATVSTNLNVAGNFKTGLRVAGTITVNQADVRIPERLPPSVVLIDVVEKNVPADLRQRKKKKKAAEPPLPIAFDVTVDVPRRFFVRGRGVESEWQGQLKIVGNLPSPQVTGALRTVRGTLDFLGQRFSLADSEIRFDGSNIADPILEIDATTTAGEVKGIVQIRGTAQNPTFNLTSDPRLPRDEVLSRVLFGADVGSLTRSQGIRLAAAAAQLATGGGPGITDRLRRLAGLDVLDVGSAGENISDTTVTAGKYIADKVLLKVEQGATANSSRVGVEIEVFKNVVVDTDISADGDSRVGIKYRIDY